MISVQSGNGHGIGAFYIDRPIGTQASFRKDDFDNFSDDQDRTIHLQGVTFHVFQSVFDPAFLHEGSLEFPVEFRGQTDCLKLRYIFGIPGGSLMGLGENALMNVVDGVETQLEDIFPGMSFGRIGAVDKPHQGGIGSQVGHRAEYG